MREKLEREVPGQKTEREVPGQSACHRRHGGHAVDPASEPTPRLPPLLMDALPPLLPKFLSSSVQAQVLRRQRFRWSPSPRRTRKRTMRRARKRCGGRGITWRQRRTNLPCAWLRRGLPHAIAAALPPTPCYSALTANGSGEARASRLACSSAAMTASSRARVQGVAAWVSPVRIFCSNQELLILKILSMYGPYCDRILTHKLRKILHFNW